MSVDQYRAIDTSSFSNTRLGEFAKTSEGTLYENYEVEKLFSKSQILLHSPAELFKSDEQFTKSTSEIESFHSIFESYNAFNEVERIQKLDHLNSAQKEYYISENVMAYLEEFVAKIRIKKLAGVLKNDGSMEMLGTNVTDMYNHAAQLAGTGSRESYEKVGLDLISKGILYDNNRAVWISPPTLKGSNYGFAFVIEADEYDDNLQGRPFRELLLRYNEPDSTTINNSRDIHRTLTERVGNPPLTDTFTTYQDFLSHPLVYSHDGFEDIDALYDYLEISPEDVRRSEDFRLQVMPVIKPYLSQYISIIQEMSLSDLTNPDDHVKDLEQSANDYIGAIFNAARIIKRRLDNEHTSSKQLHLDELQLQKLSSALNTQDMRYIAINMAQYESLVIQGGSNCEVTKQAGLGESAFISNVLSGMSIGSSMAEVGNVLDTSSKKEFDGKCVNCPNCKKTVDAIVTNKNIKCPKCKFEVKR